MHIHHALLAVTWSEEDQHALIDHLGADLVTVCSPTDRAGIAAALATADVAITNARIDQRFLDAPRLRWLHIDRAGIDRFAPPELFTGRIITNSSGRSSAAIADQALLLLLATAGSMRTVERLRRRRTWSRVPLADLRPLAGRRAVVVGCGSIGQEIARRLAPMEIATTGIGRTPRDDAGHFDRIVSSPSRQQLIETVAAADILVLAAGLNDATHHLVDADVLEALGPDGIIVNVGRGALIDQRALVRSLRQGQLAGAGLAVADPEPLPPWSRLWSAPGTVLIPHTVPRSADRDRRSVAIISAFADDVRADRPVQRALGVDDAYTLGATPRELHLRATRAYVGRIGLRLVGSRSGRSIRTPKRSRP